MLFNLNLIKIVLTDVFCFALLNNFDNVDDTCHISPTLLTEVTVVHGTRTLHC